MGALIEGLRGGDWLTRQRMRLWALAVLAASGLALVVLIATADGLNDFRGEPLGTDFSNVYSAGTFVLEGKPAEAFDWPTQYTREQQIFGARTSFFGWHYPPYFLFVAGALATMPYKLSLLAWQAATLILYLLMLRAVLASCVARREHDGGPAAVSDPLWILVALAFPAVFVNIGHGHNGFLTAALIGTALVMLDRRPILAGLLFGLLAYKPQFGLLIPLVLLATGRWRAFAAAALTVVALTLATLLAFGPEVWRAFFASTALTRFEVLEQGNTGFHKIQSVFSVVRMWGGSVPLAYVMQGVAAAAIAAALVRLWRSHAAYPLKAAALIVGSMLATPYSLDYDLVVLAPAIAFLAAHGLRHGFEAYEKAALAFLWLMPLVARTIAEHALVPLGVPAMAWVFVLLLRRAAREGSVAGTGLARSWS